VDTTDDAGRSIELTAAQTTALRHLVDRSPVVASLGSVFHAAGEELALVGGPVRDALLGRLGSDWDFATSAHPDKTKMLLDSWADATWDVGRAYGTIGGRKGDDHVEVTTYRSDAYEPDSRKPAVAYGNSLAGDLSRRDFSVNAMALALPSYAFTDPFGGLRDLDQAVLRTPVGAEQSFSDDPLRMLRAARFAAQLDFSVAPDVVAAMTTMAERIRIVAPERQRVELEKLLLAPRPQRGLRLLVDTGLATHVLPELPALSLERDEHHRHKDVYEHTLTVLDQAIELEFRLGGPDLVSRLAALMHDVGKPRTRRFNPDGSVTFHHHDVVGAKMTRKRLKALRFPSSVVDDVSTLVGLHLRFHGYGSGEWTDSAVRRYVRDAGPLLSRLHVLTRADSTTRNQRKATRLRRAYDELEARIDELAAREELDSLRPDLDGNQIMALLGIGPSREVGQAYQFLLERRMEDGPLGEERARAELLEWWQQRASM
jgi:poly(A) polymerase